MDNVHKYMIAGSIKSKSGCRQYKIQWSDGETAKQSCIHLFGVSGKQYSFGVGDHCLAMHSESDMLYLPAVVTAKTKRGDISVRFVDETDRLVSRK